MKYTLLLACIILSTIVQSHPLIHQIVYDPQGPDTGHEWIELFNPHELPIDIRNYQLYTSRGTEQDSWALTWNGSTCVRCIVQPKHYMILGDEFVSYDNRVTLRLQNTRGALKLVGPLHEEIVGYGLVDSGFYTGAPAPDVAEGSSLIRVNTTGTNSLDFVRGPAIFSIPKPFTGNVTPRFEVIVKNAPPNIETLTFSNQTIHATFSDPNGLTDIASVFYSINTNEEITIEKNVNLSCSENCSIQIPLFLRNDGIATLRVYDKSGAFSEKNISVKAGPVLEFRLGTIPQLRGLPGTEVFENITITNTGTIPFTLYLKTTVAIEFNINNIRLTEIPQAVATTEPGETLTLPLHLAIPHNTPAGILAGDVSFQVKQ